MTDNVDAELREKNEEQHPSEGTSSSSGHLLIVLEKLISQSHTHSTTRMSSIKYLSKSVDDLRTYRRHRREEQQRTKNTDENNVSNTTRTENDLSGIGYENQFECDDNQFSDDDDDNDQYDPRLQRSRSAPTSPTHIYDKEFAAFIQCDQQQQLISDSFIYNMDLSDTGETSQQSHSRAAFLFDDDYSPDDDNYELPASIIHSSLISNCLTITEENEEELEQLKRDDDEELQRQSHLCQLNDGSTPTITLHDNDDRADLLENDQSEQLTTMNSNLPLIVTETHSEGDERLSTIYESPSPQPQIEEDDDDTYDKLIVYDIAKVESNPNLSTSIPAPISSSSLSPPPYRSPIIDRTLVHSCYTNASFDPCPKLTNILSASRLCGTTTTINAKVYKPSTPVTSSLSSPVINASFRSTFTNHNLPHSQEQNSSSRSSPMSLSVPMLLLTTNEQLTSNIDPNNRTPSEHIKKMRVTQSSSSSLSDFIMPTLSSTSRDTTCYHQVPSAHHSLTDCSSVHYTQCAPPLLLDEDRLPIIKSSDDSQRRPSFTRRILTNGLLLSHFSNNPTHRRTQPPLTFTHHHHHLHYQTKTKSEEKLSSSSSSPSSPDSSSSSSSSSATSTPTDKLMSRSDFVLQHQQSIPQQRKATSLKNVYVTSPRQPPKILYPIDFEMPHNDEQWLRKRSSSSYQVKVPTSDSGIVSDTAGMGPTSNSSIEDDDGDGLDYDETTSVGLKQYEHEYRTTLTHLSAIKKTIVDIESRLNEAMRELDIERALIEGEHELLFKQILDTSEDDQRKIQQLYHELQTLIDRIMAEKIAIRNKIDYTQQVLFGLEHELHQFEQQYRPSDEKILKQREAIAETRKKHDDLEFQLMELETRCEAELEEAEQRFQNEQIIVAQNAKVRQNNLRDLDRQQHVILQQVTAEKEKLEREKQKLKLLFKKKKMQASELEQKINGYSLGQINRNQSKVTWMDGNEIDTSPYQSMPSNIYSALNYSDGIASSKTMLSENHQEKLNEIKEMIAVAKLEKMTILEQQLRERYSELVQCHDEHIKRLELEQKLADEVKNRDYIVECQVKLREKNRNQERPLTRYLPIRSVDFDLRAHIEAAGHLLNSSHIHLTSTSCRGFLHKMGGMKFKTWNRRWFVFDRKRRSLFYYQDKTETKLRGCIYFQSIVEVYVDHLQSASLRAPEPRGATFIVKTLERPYYLVAPTLEAMRIWVDVIITGAEGNTFAGES